MGKQKQWTKANNRRIKRKREWEAQKRRRKDWKLRFPVWGGGWLRRTEAEKNPSAVCVRWVCLCVEWSIKKWGVEGVYRGCGLGVYVLVEVGSLVAIGPRNVSNYQNQEWSDHLWVCLLVSSNHQIIYNYWILTCNSHCHLVLMWEIRSIVFHDLNKSPSDNLLSLRRGNALIRLFLLKTCQLWFFPPLPNVSGQRWNHTSCSHLRPCPSHLVDGKTSRFRHDPHRNTPLLNHSVTELFSFSSWAN